MYLKKIEAEYVTLSRMMVIPHKVTKYVVQTSTVNVQNVDICSLSEGNEGLRKIP